MVLTFCKHVDGCRSGLSVRGVGAARSGRGRVRLDRSIDFDRIASGGIPLLGTADPAQTAQPVLAAHPSFSSGQSTSIIRP